MADFIILLTIATLLQKYRIVPCDLTPLKSNIIGDGIDINLEDNIVLSLEPRN